MLHCGLEIAVEGGWGDRKGQSRIVSKFDLLISVQHNADLSASMQRVTCGQWDFPDKIK